eukprot:scaffold44169_cov71-Phaeocystis_antarctica.AAC.7
MAAATSLIATLPRPTTGWHNVLKLLRLVLRCASTPAKATAAGWVDRERVGEASGNLRRAASRQLDKSKPFGQRLAWACWWERQSEVTRTQASCNRPGVQNKLACREGATEIDSTEIGQDELDRIPCQGRVHRQQRDRVAASRRDRQNSRRDQCGWNTDCERLVHLRNL